MFYGIFTLRRLSISGNPHSVQLSACTLETEIECGSDSLFICLSSTAFICGHVSERIPERVSKSDDYLCNCVSNLASYISMIYEARLKCKSSNWKQKE